MITNGPSPGKAQITLLPKESKGIPATSAAGNVPSVACPVSQGDIAALSSAGHAPAVAGDFGPGTQFPDDRYAALAGLLPALRVTVPASKAEQQARDALESTLGVIDNMAESLLEQGTEVLKSGTGAQQLEMAEAIDRFLKKAESTMKGLVEDTVKELPPPQSPAMQKLAALMSDGMWRDIEKMQKALEKTLETPLPGSPGNARPNAAQREQFVTYYAELNSQNFHAQLAAIDLPAVKKPGFDARNLSGMAAMRQELEAVAKLAHVVRSARVPSPVGSGAATAIPPAGPATASSPGSPVAHEPASEGDDESDLADLEAQGADEAQGAHEERPDADEPGLEPFDPHGPASGRDR